MSPINAHFRNISVGNEVFIYTDHLQSKILVPVRSNLGDWRHLFPAEHFADRAPEADYVAFSWGDREFCTTTSDWSHASTGTALKALFAPTPAVIHVEFCRRPQPSARYRRIVLTDQRHGNLTKYLYQSFARTNGSLKHVESDVDGGGAFYQAKGAFSLLNTGNNWTGIGLKRTGVRTGIWTPLTFGLVQVDDSSDSSRR